MRLTPISWGSSSLAFEGRRLAGSSSLADCSLSRRCVMCMRPAGPLPLGRVVARCGRGGFIASAEGSSFSAVLPVEGGKLGLRWGCGPG
jgi:hypothetical protein